ncbi:uncharacterized protein PG986_004305 [Apiospora aurea]|uniref:Uncharacterized protein n=1 Tax=Apiospora aurea TaxID=335848 RepID=A0ABR1QM81_9PEZI
MRRPMHESVVAKLQKHEVVPSSNPPGPIVLEVESSYCEGCQESKMRSVHESLHALQRDLVGLDPSKLNSSNHHHNNNEKLLLRQEDELRDVFRELEEAQLTAELAPRHFRGALRVFAEICVAAVAPPERLRGWVQTLTTNDYMVGDVQRAIEERLMRSGWSRMGKGEGARA